MIFVTGALALANVDIQRDRGYRGLPSAIKTTIERWNEVVKSDDDIVYVCGGMTEGEMDPKKLANILYKLNGRIVWLCEDEPNGEEFLEEVFDLTSRHKLIMRDRPLLIEHYGRTFVLSCFRRDYYDYWNICSTIPKDTYNSVPMLGPGCQIFNTSIDVCKTVMPLAIINQFTAFVDKHYVYDTVEPFSNYAYTKTVTMSGFRTRTNGIKAKLSFYIGNSKQPWTTVRDIAEKIEIRWTKDMSTMPVRQAQ